MDRPSEHDASRQQVRTSRTASIAPSMDSVFSDTSTVVPPNHVQRGFKTREAYLAALQEFADEHSHMSPGEYTIKGVYGTTTIADYQKRKSLGEERRERKAKAERERQRQATRDLESLPETSHRSGQLNVQHRTGETLVQNLEPRAKESRMRRLSRVLTGGQRAAVE